MQDAATVLGVLRDRGRRGLPLDEVYRQLFNPQLYLLAIGRLYSNHGAMTPGADGQTVDGTSLAEVWRIIDAMRHERYRFQPVKRVYIPKKNGKKRPLGLPSWADKLVGEVFLRLLRNMLRAGYLEDWEWNATLSGAPQGGVVSPILSNIYLDRLDTFAETVLIPEYTRGEVRAKNPAYRKVESALRCARKRGDRALARQLRKQLRSMPSMDPRDPGYRRLRYIRYADDTLLGFTGPKAEAEQIKIRLATFLRDDLNLELSEEKTLITHARTQAARFLGYEITVQHSDHKVTRGYRRANGTVALRTPKTVVKANCAPYLKGGKPVDRPELRNCDDHTIVAIYGSRYRGIAQYYLLAGDVWRLDRLEWVMKTSMLKTLAAKHRSTVTKMARKHKATIATPAGPRRCFEATVERAGRKPLVARFGGIPLHRHKKAILNDRLPALAATRRKELVTRLTAGRCELCEQPANTEIHQVPKLADLTRPGPPQPAWNQLMAKKQRKTLIVCRPCHDTIHTRQPTTATRINHRRAG